METRQVLTLFNGHGLDTAESRRRTTAWTKRAASWAQAKECGCPCPPKSVDACRTKDRSNLSGLVSRNSSHSQNTLSKLSCCLGVQTGLPCARCCDVASEPSSPTTVVLDPWKFRVRLARHNLHLHRQTLRKIDLLKQTWVVTEEIWPECSRSQDNSFLGTRTSRRQVSTTLGETRAK